MSFVWGSPKPDRQDVFMFLFALEDPPERDYDSEEVIPESWEQTGLYIVSGILAVAITLLLLAIYLDYIGVGSR